MPQLAAAIGGHHVHCGRRRAGQWPSRHAAHGVPHLEPGANLEMPLATPVTVFFRHFCVCLQRKKHTCSRGAAAPCPAMRYRAAAQQRMGMRAKVHTTRLPVQQQPAATPVNHRAASCRAGRLMGARCACPHLAVWPQREQQHDGVHLPCHGRAHARRRAP